MPESCRNSYGQIIGVPVPEWKAAGYPRARLVKSHHCNLRPLVPRDDAPQLWAALNQADSQEQWTYLPYGPFDNEQSFREHLEDKAQTRDVFFTIVSAADGKALGTVAYSDADPEMGAVRIGPIHLAPEARGTAVSTNALYLMLAEAFEQWGYRRCEWLCDGHDGHARRVALRIGFRFEGLRQQAWVYKGRNGDAASFSLINADWPATRRHLDEWLSPSNFSARGQQLKPLGAVPPQPDVAVPATRRHWETM